MWPKGNTLIALCLQLLIAFSSIFSISTSATIFNPYPHHHHPFLVPNHNVYYHHHRHHRARIAGPHHDFPYGMFNTQKRSRRSRPPQPRSYNSRTFNVDDFGARADGSDDSQVAFIKAWKAACSSTEGAILVVPQGKVYQLKPVEFSGPCRSAFTVVEILGTITASREESDYEKDRRHWVVFENVHNLRVEGGGRIDGNGDVWWKKSCKIDKSLPCKDAPTAVTFMDCSNLVVHGIDFLNAQKMHLSFQNCVGVRALHLSLTAPGDSPNTDGIHVTATKNILIKNCIVRTGDDCISIVSGSKNVRAMGITCGPGHGISIGSLGEGNSEAFVSNVVVNNAKLSGTTNGVRIKTWQGGKGFARNIIFQNVEMHNVTNPIIIDQNYCDQDAECPEQKSAVQVSNVLYRNIRGTSSTDTAVKFDCSRSIPCQGILMQNVMISSEEDDRSVASCSNVKFDTRGRVFPQCSNS